MSLLSVLDLSAFAETRTPIAEAQTWLAGRVATAEAAGELQSWLGEGPKPVDAPSLRASADTGRAVWLFAFCSAPPPALEEDDAFTFSSSSRAELFTYRSPWCTSIYARKWGEPPKLI